MEYQQLGATGPVVSALGLGFWSIGGAFGPADTAESRRTVAHAIARGVTLFDAAPAYGSSEAFLGDVLSSGDRQKVFLMAEGLRRLAARGATAALVTAAHPDEGGNASLPPEFAGRFVYVKAGFQPLRRVYLYARECRVP